MNKRYLLGVAAARKVFLKKVDCTRYKRICGYSLQKTNIPEFMKRKSIILIASALLLSIMVCRAQGDTALLLKQANVVDVVSGNIERNTSLFIEHGKIVAIGKRAGKRAKAAQVIDLKGAYVVPGLIDAHVHVANGKGVKPEQSLSHLQYFLKHGITTVRDAAGDAGLLQVVQQKIRSGEAQGADVYYAAFMAGDWYFNRGQHLHKEPYTAWEQCIQPGVDLDSAMKAAKDCGATGLKLYHSIDSAFLTQVVQAAHRHQLKIWGHAMMYPARPLQIVEAGVEVLSHAYMLAWINPNDSMIGLATRKRNRPMSKEAADSFLTSVDVTAFCNAMKAKNAILDATLCVSEQQGDDYAFTLLKKVHAQGVKVCAGTDQIVDFKRPYPRLMDELDYYVSRCGFTNLEALQSATLIAAEAIGQENNIGAVAPGKKADLLVLAANPLENILHLQKQVMVIQNGRQIR